MRPALQRKPQPKILRKSPILIPSKSLKVASLIGTEKPDILVTDIIMPDQEGLSTIMQVRKNHPLLPIIAMSGGGRLAGNDYLSLYWRRISVPMPP